MGVSHHASGQPYCRFSSGPRGSPGACCLCGLRELATLLVTLPVSVQGHGLGACHLLLLVVGVWGNSPHCWLGLLLVPFRAMAEHNHLLPLGSCGNSPCYWSVLPLVPFSAVGECLALATSGRLRGVATPNPINTYLKKVQTEKIKLTEKS